MRLRYIYLCFLTMLSFIAPARGQTSGGSSIASLTVLSSDTAKVLERRVYDNGLGDRVLHHTAKPNIARTFGVMPPELTPVQTLNADTTDYLLGGSLVMTNGTVDKVLFDGGFADVSSSGSFVLFYYNKDHLGNNREALIRSGSVFQVTRYYPFGAQYAGSTEISGVNIQPYKYNFSIKREKRKVACSSEREKNRPKVSGKELDTMHGLDTYDYGARQYDPILGRWDRMDPLCEKYYDVSPYEYCHNNPIRLTDMDGMDDLFDINGNFIMDTGCGRNVYILKQGKRVLLSSFDYYEISNQTMLCNVASHYIGISDYQLFQVSVDSDINNVDGAALAYLPQDAKYYVCIKNGRINSVLDDKYDFQSITDHERIHRYDSSTHGGGLGEVGAIIQQTKENSWAKTSNIYKQSQFMYALKSLNKVAETLTELDKNIYYQQLSDAFNGASYNVSDNIMSGFLDIELTVKGKCKR